VKAKTEAEFRVALKNA